MKRLLALAALSLPLAAAAQTPQPVPPGMVTSADPRATEVGQTILREGGSAADAAMAMMLALTVVEPQSSGIGGGGFLLYQRADRATPETIDGRETAPAAATPERFLGADGQPLPFGQAFPGGKSTGVPGNIRLMALAEKKWGKLPWKALFQPAIRLAEQGYSVTPPLAAQAAMVGSLWSNFPATAAQYGTTPPAVGEIVRNPALAATLRQIAAQGPEAFYTGANARALVAAARGAAVRPSDITLADLAAYRAKERPPICGAYRQYTICSMGPPSAGAITVIGVLTLLERFDLHALGKDSPVAWHLIGEAMRLVYADRDLYMGDTDFVTVPLKGLTDRAYLASRSAMIRADATLPAYLPGTPPGASPRSPATSGEVPSTTHFIAIDRAGNIATMTSTIEGPFGSQIIASGYMLNNELTDFSFAPTKGGAPVANRVQGGKRPLSSMAPTIVYADGKPVFVAGAAGGRTIPMQVIKALIAHLDWGLSARDALAEPLVYYRGDALVLEQGTKLEAMRPALERLGHKVIVAPLGLKANAAERTATGWVGAADPRSVGTALSE